MTNPDFYFPSEWPDLRLGPGAYTYMLRQLFKQTHGYDIEITQFGKPCVGTYDFAENHVESLALKKGHEISNYYMIGDNPLSDIHGAN